MLSDKEYISQGLSHWSSCRSAINSFFVKFATSAVDLARILLPRMVWSISFWEQCSRAPPLFAPLEPKAQVCCCFWKGSPNYSFKEEELKPTRKIWRTA